MATEQTITDARTLREFLIGEISDVGRFHDLQVELGAECESVLNNSGFQIMLHELINNCAEKPAPDIDIGVLLRAVYVKKKSGFRLEVTDNVRYEPDNPEIGLLLENLNAKKTKSGKKNALRDGVGGIGIGIVRNQLTSWGGSLKYVLTPEGTITAIAEWQKDLFEHPRAIRQKKLSQLRQL